MGFKRLYRFSSMNTNVQIVPESGCCHCTNLIYKRRQRNNQHLGLFHIKRGFTLPRFKQNGVFPAGFQWCTCDYFLQRAQSEELKYVTPMSFSWHGAARQLSSEESEVCGRFEQWQRGVWRRKWDTDLHGWDQTLSQPCWSAHPYWSLWTLSVSRCVTNLYKQAGVSPCLTDLELTSLSHFTKENVRLGLCNEELNTLSGPTFGENYK